MLTAIAFSCPAASAKDLFVAQSAAGTGGGADCANALAVTFFNTASSWSQTPSATKINPGDTVHLCGTILSALTIQGSGASGSPVTILFEPNAIMTAGNWTATGAISCNGRNFIVLDGGANGVIQATANGTALATQVDSRGAVFTNCNNVEIRNLSVLNMYVRTPNSSDACQCGVGIVENGGSNFLIRGNTITNAYEGIAIVYPGSATTSGIRIHDNTVSRTSTALLVGSGNINALADSVQLFNNDLSDGFPWEGIICTSCTDNHFHNNGVHIFAVHTGSTITNLSLNGNYVHGDWGGHCTAWLFVEGLVSNYTIYNNLLTTANGSSPTNGFIFAKGPGSGVLVANNTIDGSGVGLAFEAQGMTNATYKNNIAVNMPTGLFIDSDSTLAASNFNVFTGLGANQMFYRTGFYSFSLWQTRLGFDLASTTNNPSLDATYHLQAGSPAIGIGANLSSFFSIDRAGVPRPTTGNWDLGCYIFTASATPSTPTNLTVIVQ